MKREFTEKVIIRSEWCDAEDMLTLKGLANLLENQADRHLSTVKMGGSDFLKQGMAWVIVRREADINRLPAKGETVKVTTWSGAFRHGICPRWFEIFDDAGNLIIDVSCQWVVISAAERDIIFKGDFMSLLPFCDKADHGKTVSMPKDCHELTETEAFSVAREWIDKNGHVNNGYYLKWIEKIATKAMNGRPPAYFWIEYSREIIPEDSVEIKWAYDGSLMYFEGFVNANYENRMFYAIMKFGDAKQTEESGKTMAKAKDTSTYITDDIILSLYEEYNTPEHVKRHCRGVTDCALRIARALNACGHHLDTDLIYGAGMVHDMARTQDRHWTVAADKLDEMGFHREADIVRVHMEPGEYSPVDSITERDMICLGDRLVKEDQYVGIDERFDYIIDKAKRHGVLDFRNIMKNKAKMQQCLDSIESVIGCSIDDLFK